MLDTFDALKKAQAVRLSEHFTLDEFLRSEAAARAGRAITPDEWTVALPNLRRLAEDVLEPLRLGLGRPVVLLSGLRPDWLNVMVGGSQDSDHVLGLAADILVPGVRPIVVCNLAVSLGLPFRQCIHEFGRWTHLSARRPSEVEARREVLTAVKSEGRRVAYLSGLVEAA
jgi:hypothetical protein